MPFILIQLWDSCIYLQTTIIMLSYPCRLCPEVYHLYLLRMGLAKDGHVSLSKFEV